MTLRPITISKHRRSVTKAAKDPANDEDVDQEPLAKRQKTARAFGKAAKDPTNDQDVDQQFLAERKKTSGACGNGRVMRKSLVMAGLSGITWKG